MSGSSKWFGLCAAIAALCLWVTPASAFPVPFPVVFGGPGGFGVSASTATAAQVAGYSLITDTPVSPANTVPLLIPAPDVLSSHLVSSPSVGNPNTAQSRWTVTNGGGVTLNDAWLVFLTPLTYTPSQVGIDLQPVTWRLVQVPFGQDTYYYPAVFLGDLAPDANTTFLMNHIVGQTLTQQGQTLILPQYQVGVLVGVPLPEASSFLLVVLGLGVTAALRRGKV